MQRKKPFPMLFALLVSTMSACNPPEKASLESLEAAGTIPKLDRSESLTGTDADANGVRDDIDAFIAREYPNEPQRKAALQTARALQEGLLVQAGDVPQAKAAMRQTARGIDCVYEQFPVGSPKSAARVSRELEAITTNTKARLLAHLRLSETLDGTSWSSTGKGACE